MGWWGSFTGSDQADDIRAGQEQATASLKSGYKGARDYLNQGTSQANSLLGDARGYNNQTLKYANYAVNNGANRGINYLNPYIESGQQANALYGNALGLNGVESQREFGQNYAASDPFRAQNADFATEALFRGLNARGLSGGGYAAQAVATENLRRGSEDYGNYLNRLSGQAQSGQQAAGQAAGIRYNQGQAVAGNYGTYAGMNNALFGQQSQNLQNRGNNLADLRYGYAQQRAGQATGTANALAANRSTGWNNLFNAAGVAAKAVAGAG